MRPRVALLALVLLVAATLATPAVAQQASSSANAVTVEVYLQPNGDARWNVSTRFPLNSTADRAAFDRLEADYESGADVGFTASTFRELAASAEAKTGTEMRIREVNRTAYVEERPDGNATGVVSLRFTWTNFANATGDRLVVGHAFAGSWSLGADQRLFVYPPEGYAVDSVRPSTQITNGGLEWTGPRRFAAGEPAVVYVRSGGNGGTDGNGENGGNGGGGLVDRLTGTAFLLAVAGALVLGGVLVYGWLHRDRLVGESTADAGATPDASPDAAATSSAGPPAEQTGDDGGERADAEPDVDPQLLSDEERVERLLDQRGGRMKQANIVKETGWSNAKVSQLLSGMDEDGRIEKLRIGRENLITLAEDAEEE